MSNDLLEKSYINEATLSEMQEEDWIKKLITSGKTSQLVSLLSENHSFYTNRGSRQCEKFRIMAMVGLGTARLPREALPYVLEALESGRTPAMIAAGAIAIRGLNKPLFSVVPFLLKGLERLKKGDETLVLPEFRGSTAMNEICTTLEMVMAITPGDLECLEQIAADRFNDFSPNGQQALRKAVKTLRPRILRDNCCDRLPINVRQLRGRKKIDLTSIMLENQDGNIFSYQQIFTGKISVLGLFYTRCDNPLKCSFTISKMAALQRCIDPTYCGLIQIAALTYDPLYDLPARLRHYAAGRGFEFNQSSQMLRCTKGFDNLRKYFDLAVNYNSSMVNQHGIELLIIDEKGCVAIVFDRVQWNVEEVAAAAMRKAEQLRRKAFLRKGWSGIYPALLSLIVAFFPKCPLCWMSYMSVIGISGLVRIPYSPWLLPVFISLTGLHFYAIGKKAFRYKFYLPLIFSLAGIFFLYVLAFGIEWKWAIWPGVLFILAGSIASSYFMLRGHETRSPGDRVNAATLLIK